MPKDRVPEIIANEHCQVGENPLWDEGEQALYWVDIERGRLFRFDHASGRHECIYHGEPIGGFTFQDDGTILLFGVNRIWRFDGKAAVIVREGIDDTMARFNDVYADPTGRVYAGTNGYDDKGGGLYRIDTDGSITELFKGTGCSNGTDLTPSGKHLYWTDSTANAIYRFAYDEKSGALSHRETFVQVDRSQGTVDGLMVDAEGCVWSARWDGYAVFRYSPTGDVLETIELPVGKVSSVAFGGPDGDELYITTAGGSPDTDTLDGALFRIKTNTRARPQYKSKVKFA
jgi:sugar lactone lactonase YvrE